MRIGGLDWGGRIDATALAVLDATGMPQQPLPRSAILAGHVEAVSTLVPPIEMRLRAMRHLPAIGSGFGEQLADLAPDLGTLDALALDVGGVGAALPELVETYLPRGCLLLPVHIVGGMGENHHPGRTSLGKQRLIGSLVRVANEGRLAIDPAALGADILLAEMALFAHRQGGKMEAAKGHDDAVLAMALAVWIALRLAGDEAAAPTLVDAEVLMQRRQRRADAWRTG